MSYLENIAQLKSELDNLRPLKPEVEQRILQKIRLDWNYHSNNLEGNSLTYGETKALILFGITSQGKPLKDHIEITGHDEAIKWVYDIIKDERTLTENFIRELHTLILKEPYEVDAITPEGKPTKKRIEIGKYKTTPNHVLRKTGEVLHFATPEETPAKMMDLIDWYRKKTETNEIHAILLASEFHYKFIRIHPFDDGNGRTARILMNFILMKYGYPPVVIKTEEKAEYIRALQQADAGILEPFVEFIAKNLTHSLEIMLKGAKGESIDDPDDLDKEIRMLEEKLKRISKPIEVVKSEEAILEVFDKSIVPLIFAFEEKSKKFERLYVESKFKAFINHLLPFENVQIFINEIKKMIKHKSSSKLMNIFISDINTLLIEYHFNYLKHSTKSEYNYLSNLYIKLNNTTFEILDSSNNTLIKKLYSEQLSKDEIDKLIKSEMDLHTQFINKKIEEINKSNNKE